MRWFATLVLALALGVMGCSETAGTGGSGGDGGQGGSGGNGVSDCSGVENFTPCEIGDTSGWCLDETCLVRDCSDIEDGTDCYSMGERVSGAGLCVAGICEGITRCEEDADCNFDGNDCTTETCLANGLCEEGGPVQDGTFCAGGTCQGGACMLESSTVPCSEQGIRNAIAAGGGPYTLDCDEPTTVVLRATIWVDNDVILDGKGVTLDARNAQDTAFRVVEQVEVEFNGFTLIGGDHAGIYNGGNLTLANSTAAANPGWGIDNDGLLTVINSTVSGNTGDAQIFNQGSVALINSTVSGNSGVGLDNNAGTLTVTNSLVDGDCAGDVTSNGYNIESPGNTCGFDQPTDQVNVSAVGLNLGPLQDNGGPTMTHALGEGSVAINQIPAEDCVDADGAPLTTDQRGDPRPFVDPWVSEQFCDVGAVEATYCINIVCRQ